MDVCMCVYIGIDGRTYSYGAGEGGDGGWLQ